MFNDSNLPDDLDARVRSELRDGERLSWVGQPRPSRFARQAIPFVLFGIPFTAFAVFWVAMASGILFGEFGNKGGRGGVGAPSACFPLFGLPFVLIGLWMLSSPYWFWRQARRTCYALTNRRAIIWQAGTFGAVSVRSYGPEALGQLHRTEYADGSGDLVFEVVVSVRNRTATTIRHGFLAIRDVREIEELVRRVLLPSSR
jgi:hypothetical protein